LLLTIGKPLYKPVFIPTVKGNATVTSASKAWIPELIAAAGPEVT